MSLGVYCEKCGREIKFTGELVSTNFMFKVVPYHEAGNEPLGSAGRKEWIAIFNLTAYVH